MRFRPLPLFQFADALLQQMWLAVREAITTLQRDAEAHRSIVIPAVALPDATDITVAHKLGRAPVFVRESCVRGASTGGCVTEVRSSAIDRTKFIMLRAIDYGADIVADIEVR